MASNSDDSHEISVWGDMVLETNRPKPIFADKLKRSDGKMSLEAKLETTDQIDLKEIILHFQEKLKDAGAVQQLMQLSPHAGKQRWNRGSMNSLRKSRTYGVR